MVIAQHQGIHGAHIDGDTPLNIGSSRPNGMSTTSNGECCVVMGID